MKAKRKRIPKGLEAPRLPPNTVPPIGVYVDATERATIIEAVRLAGERLSTWCKAVLVSEAERRIKQAAKAAEGGTP